MASLQQGADIDGEEGMLTGSAVDDEAKKKCPGAPLAQTAEQVKSIVFKATHKGFSPGSVVAFKLKERQSDDVGPGVICTIRTIGEEESELATATLGDECKTITVKTEKLIVDWRLSNERIPVKIDGWSCGWATRRWEWEGIQLQALF